MFTLLKALSRSRKTPAPVPAHRPAFEPLEGRQLHSATPVAVNSFASSADTQQALLLPAVQAAREARTTSTATSGGYLLTSIQHSGGVNTNGIIAVLIGL